MKKIISLLLVFVLACTALVSCGGGGGEQTSDPDTILNIDPNLSVDAGYGLDGKTPTDASNFKFKELADGTIAITGSYIDKLKDLKEVVVPAVINGKKVSTLGESALANLTGVETITIGGYVTEIQAYAFRDCGRLTSIKLPDFVKTLGEGVFSGCGALKDIELPMSVETLGARVFEKTAITSFVIPNSVSKVGGYTFVGCESIAEVQFSKRMTEIPERMFMGCNTLNNTIGSEGFVIPENIKSIGTEAFFGCLKIKSVSIPEGVTKIGKKAFDTCRMLASVTIPSTVTFIGDNAFNTCTKLSEVTFLCAGNKDVVTIGKDLFRDTKKVEAFNVVAGSAAEEHCKAWKQQINDEKLKGYNDTPINVK